MGAVSHTPRSAELRTRDSVFEVADGDSFVFPPGKRTSSRTSVPKNFSITSSRIIRQPTSLTIQLKIVGDQARSQLLQDSRDGLLCGRRIAVARDNPGVNSGAASNEFQDYGFAFEVVASRTRLANGSLRSISVKPFCYKTLQRRGPAATRSFKSRASRSENLSDQRFDGFLTRCRPV